ncbi:Uncharacterised protein [Providencia rettgeri]|nr:Uncharacterised protein [Providencia rettgeri]
MTYSSMKNHVSIGAGLDHDLINDIEDIIKVTNLLMCLFCGQVEDTECHDNKAISALFCDINRKLKEIHGQIYELPKPTVYTIKDGKLNAEIKL